MVQYDSQLYFSHQISLQLRVFQFRDRFVFNTSSQTLKCDEDPGALQVVMFKIEYQHPLFHGPLEHVPAMLRVKRLIKEAGIQGRVFARSTKATVINIDVNSLRVFGTPERKKKCKAPSYTTFSIQYNKKDF